MDKVGLVHFNFIVLIFLIGMTLTEMIRKVWAQTAFLYFYSLINATLSLIYGKWPLYFLPPSVFGMTYGSFTAIPGVCGILYSVVASLFDATGDIPIFIFLLCGSVLYAILCLVMVQSGLPCKPPRNKYDTAERLFQKARFVKPAENEAEYFEREQLL